MGNPSVTATISAHDQATAVIMQFAQNARKAAYDLEKAFHGAGNKAGADMRKMAAEGNAAANQLRGHAEGMRSNALVIAGGFTALAGAARGAYQQIRQISGEISELTGRMQAYGGASRETAEAIRQLARVQGVQGPGGQKGMMEAAYAGQKANLSPDAAKRVAKYGQQYARLVGANSAGEGMEQLLQLVAMDGGFRDEKGNEVTPDKLSPEAVERAIAKRLGEYITEARRLPGKESDIFEFKKMAGPEMAQLNVPPEVQQAFQIAMAQKGITGSHAGTYARGIFARAMPTAKGLQAQRTLGVDAMEYATLDKEMITKESVVEGLQTRFGTLNEKTVAGLEKAIADYQKRGDGKRLSDNMAQALTHSGVKQLVDAEKGRKAVQEQLGMYVKDYDVLREIQDAKSKGAGAAYFKNRFGIESGTGAAAVAVFAEYMKTLVPELRKEKQETDFPKVAEEAEQTFQSTFGAQLKRAEENFKSLVDGMFQPWESTATGALYAINSVIEAFNGSSESARRLGSEYVALAGAVAALKGFQALKDVLGPKGPAGVPVPVGGGAVGGVAGNVAGGVAGGAATTAVTKGAPLARLLLGPTGLALGVGVALSQYGAELSTIEDADPEDVRAWRRGNAPTTPPATGPEGLPEDVQAAINQHRRNVWRADRAVLPWVQDGAPAVPFLPSAPTVTPEGAVPRTSVPIVVPDQIKDGGGLITKRDLRDMLDQAPRSLDQKETERQPLMTAPATLPPSTDGALPSLLQELTGALRSFVDNREVKGDVKPGEQAGQQNVVVQGEGKMDAQVRVLVEPSQDLRAFVTQQVQTATLHMRRDPLGTSLGGPNGTTPAPGNAPPSFPK